MEKNNLSKFNEQLSSFEQNSKNLQFVETFCKGWSTVEK